MEGDPSGIGAGPGAGSAGGACPVQTEASVRQSAKTLIACKKRPNMFPPFFLRDDRRKKKRPEAPTMVCNWTSSSSLNFWTAQLRAAAKDF
jgi:hypothetical protein